MSQQVVQRKRRKDAIANRERLLDEAERYFADHGLDAPLHALAKAADVGIATLYRNFPSHADLIKALYDRTSARFDDLVDECANEATGWEAIEKLIRRGVGLMLTYPASKAILRRQAQYDPSYQPPARWGTSLAGYLKRAKAEGSVRLDVTSTDLATIPFVLSSMQTFPEDQRHIVAERHLTLLIDGIKAHPHEPSKLPAQPLSATQHHALIHGRVT